MADAEVVAVEVQREYPPPIVRMVDPLVDVLAEAPEIVAADQLAPQLLSYQLSKPPVCGSTRRRYQRFSMRPSPIAQSGAGSMARGAMTA